MPYKQLSPQRESPTTKIMIFTEGTVLGPKNLLGLYFHTSYIPIGQCLEKIRIWEEQGAEILYLTSRKSEKQVNDIIHLLKKNSFPGVSLYYREKNQKYKDIIQEVKPDILIEDDCRSIGGKWQMCITHMKPELKEEIKSVVVKEFKGIDHLSDLLTDMMDYNGK